jgi:hypothetical protein
VEILVAPAGAMQSALRTDTLNAFGKNANSPPDAPPVHFQLLFTGTARADAAAQAREYGSVSRKPGQQVVQLGEFHLELPFPAASPAGEDIEDDLGAIDDLQI